MQAFRSTRVVTPEGVHPATILVEAEEITAIHPWDTIPSNIPLHDFGNHVILPGLVDTHVHINDPGRDWEGFRTATQAAASGGVTALVDMPLNCVPETISAAALEAKRSAASGNTHVDWMPWGGIVGNASARSNTAEIPALIAAGVPGFKCFLIHSGIDGFAWTDEPQLRKALEALHNSNLPLLVHAELADPVTRATAALHSADWRSYQTYLASRPDASELEAIQFLIRLAAEYNAHIHIVHLATAQALDAIRQARASGLRITVETCLHYLHFSAEKIPDRATQYKCAPPIRDAANREALWQALQAGLIDFVATDHSPCPPALKKLDASDPDHGRFDRAWGGIASLGLALPILHTGLTARTDKNPFPLLARWLASEPARLAGIPARKGSIAPGHHADFAIFDPDALWTVTESDLHFRHKFSPYLGAQLRGRILETWLRGRRIFDRSKEHSHLFSTPQGQEL
jgi:allantoinase